MEDRTKKYMCFLDKVACHRGDIRLGGCNFGCTEICLLGFRVGVLTVPNCGVQMRTNEGLGNFTVTASDLIVGSCGQKWIVPCPRYYGSFPPPSPTPMHPRGTELRPPADRVNFSACTKHLGGRWQMCRLSVSWGLGTLCIRVTESSSAHWQDVIWAGFITVAITVSIPETLL